MFDNGRLDVPAYLARLGVTHDGPPSVDKLVELHSAQCERVPYETLEFQLGRPTTIDPYESAARIITGRGGYCYHLNGALSALLHALGYHVTWHVGGVFHGLPDGPPSGNHLVLTVRLDGVEWFVDTGLGNAIHEPVPLADGVLTQGPFRYRLRRRPGGWRFAHDTSLGSFTGMDFDDAPAAPADFVAKHIELSTSPESKFVQIVSVQRRDAGGVDQMRGAIFTRYDAAGRHERTVSDPDDWYATLRDTFGLALADVDAAARARLWDTVWTAHRNWISAA